QREAVRRGRGGEEAVSGRRLALLGVFLAAPLAAAIAPPIPTADLARLEPAVAEQIHRQQESLRNLYARDPEPRERGRAWVDLGTTFHAYKLAGPAEESYKKAIELDAQDARWPHLLGGLLEEGGRLDEAVAAFSKAVALQPDDEPALVHLGEIHFLAAR